MEEYAERLEKAAPSTIKWIQAKRILTRNRSTDWFGTDHTMNLYRGCPHGCVYCDSRSECYQDDCFDQVKGKENALELLRNELRRKIRPAFISMGSMSDPYNPYEKELELTKKALMLIYSYECGVAVCTKSDLILRDRMLYGDIQKQAPVICKLTVTTMDESLAGKLEPGAPTPKARMKAVEGLSAEGIFTGILLMPVLPFLEDDPKQVMAVVDAAAEAGAKFVYAFFGVTCRDRQRAYLYQALEQKFPGVRTQYEKRFGNQYQCLSPKAKELWGMLRERCEEKGLLCEMKHIVAAAKRPYLATQLTIFDM